MQAHRGTFKITAMSRVFNVSRSGFYTWRKRQSDPSPRQQRRIKLDVVVKEAFEGKKGRSGSPRLVLDLMDEGLLLSSNERKRFPT
jgi:putative transposase